MVQSYITMKNILILPLNLRRNGKQTVLASIPHGIVWLDGAILNEGYINAIIK